AGDEYQKIIEQIREQKRILLVSHINPDGDAIGSTIALSMALQHMGKNVSAMCADEVPDKYRFLEQSKAITNQFDTIDLIIKVNCQDTVVDKVSYNLADNVLNLVVTPASGRFAFDDVIPSYGKPNVDLVITLDTPDLLMLGTVYTENEDFFRSVPVLNIDHHASNSRYGTSNLVDEHAPATGEIVLKLLEQMGVDIDPDMATALLTAVITDTGSFQHASTTAGSFSAAGKLMELGGRLQQVVDHVYRTKSVNTLKLWGRILSSLQYEQKEQIVWAVVSQKDFEECSAGEEQAETALNDLIASVPEAKIALLLYEYPAAVVRGSIRVTEGYNASEIAGLFGGGGHRPAAGFRLQETDLASAQQMVIGKLREYLLQKPAASPATPEEIISKISKMMDEEVIKKPGA
ncbi:MAG TPA: bifunctional oligoribonuclease/PAP phosphatase NrnA, partial [bacterium]|nr:bifunctional oligoribonuclease/PAP phosphatase NrnA [bacterium]